MIIILCAPSGSGKSTMVRHLLETHPDKYELSISATTRAPRGQEQHGKEYYFISRDEFEQHINNKDFIEVLKSGNYSIIETFEKQWWQFENP